jgi:hypothetical protein
MSDETTKIKCALSLAAKGFKVIPLRPNTKFAAIDNWPEKATSDPKIIERYWKNHPDHNIGIVGNEALVILDEDNKPGKNGHQSLLQLELNNADLPDTLTSITPTGGKHYFLKVPEGGQPIGNSASKIGEGLDVRGVGGYVVAPGSTIDGKAYRWQTTGNAALAECPQWLAKLALAHKAPSQSGDPQKPLVQLDMPETVKRATTWLQQAEPAVQGAGGDQRTYITAAHLKDMGISEAQALELMLDHWNERCAPAWLPDDLLIKIHNAYGYGQNAPGNINPNADFPVTSPRAFRRADSSWVTSSCETISPCWSARQAPAKRRL